VLLITLNTARKRQDIHATVTAKKTAGRPLLNGLTSPFQNSAWLAGRLLRAAIYVRRDVILHVLRCLIWG